MIFRSRQLHTPSSIPKPLAIPTNLIWDTIGGDSDQYTMIFAWFSVFWLSVLNGQNLEARFGRIEQWNGAYTWANTIRIHSWYLITGLNEFWDVGCPGLVLFDYNDSVRMKRTDRNRKFEHPNIACRLCRIGFQWIYDYLRALTIIPELFQVRYTITGSYFQNSHTNPAEAWGRRWARSLIHDTGFVRDTLECVCTRKHQGFAILQQ